MRIAHGSSTDPWRTSLISTWTLSHWPLFFGYHLAIGSCPLNSPHIKSVSFHFGKKDVWWCQRPDRSHCFPSFHLPTHLVEGCIMNIFLWQLWEISCLVLLSILVCFYQPVCIAHWGVAFLLGLSFSGWHTSRSLSTAHLCRGTSAE